MISCLYFVILYSPYNEALSLLESEKQTIHEINLLSQPCLPPVTFVEM